MNQYIYPDEVRSILDCSGKPTFLLITLCSLGGWTSRGDEIDGVPQMNRGRYAIAVWLSSEEVKIDNPCFRFSVRDLRKISKFADTDFGIVNADEFFTGTKPVAVMFENTFSAAELKATEFGDEFKRLDKQRQEWLKIRKEPPEESQDEDESSRDARYHQLTLDEITDPRMKIGQLVDNVSSNYITF